MTSREYKNRAFFFIIATVVIDMLGIGLVWPILPQLVKEITGESIAQSAGIYGLLLSGYAIVQFLVAPFVGMLSDRFGRRPVLLMSLAGLGVDYVILALAPNLAWIIVGRLLAGLFGATVSTSYAYIADITPPKKRAASFGMLGAAFGVGFIAGPLLGGVLGEIDLRYPFWAAAALSFLNLIFGYFYVPESLPPEKRSPLVLLKANPFSALQHMTRYPALPILLIAFFLPGIAQQGLQGIWVLWTQAQFGWGVAEAGYSLAWVGICMAFVQGYLVRRVVARFGESWTVFVGYTISMAAFVLLPLVTAGWVIYLGIFVHILGWGCAGPSLQALMSQKVPETQQGLLQGTVTSVNTITMIVGPLLATQIFRFSSGPDAIFPLLGAFYFFGAGLFIITLAILAFDARKANRP